MPGPRRCAAAVVAVLAVLALAVGVVAAGPAYATPPTTTAGTDALPLDLPGVDTPLLQALRKQAAAARLQLEAATRAYEAGTLAAARQRAEATALRADAARARDRVATLRQRIDEYAADAYRYTPVNEIGVVVDLFDDADPTRLADGLNVVDRVRGDQNRTLDQLTASLEAARLLAAKAEATAKAAAAAERRLAQQRDAMRALAERSQATLAAAVKAADAALAAANAEALARSQGAAARWRAYVARVRLAKLRPPAAAALAVPGRLPQGLQPVTVNARTVAGVAQTRDAAGKRLLVLPSEAMTAVGRALAAVGTPYATGGDGRDGYDCGHLVAAAFAGAVPASPDRQYAVLRDVPRDAAEPGDVVYLGDSRLGIAHVGIYVGDDQMVAASRRLRTVAVEPVPLAGVLRVARVALGRGAPQEVPTRDEGMPVVTCGAADFTMEAGPGEARAAWGGYANGLIPDSALCTLHTAPGHRLRCDAALAFDAMSRAYQQDVGQPLCAGDSYRSYAEQVAVYATKPDLAAVPGTSNHGWGLAVDFCGGVERFGSTQHAWMAAHAGAYGWFHPAWAEANGSKPEAWHWEFGHIS